MWQHFASAYWLTAPGTAEAPSTLHAWRITGLCQGLQGMSCAMRDKDASLTLLVDAALRGIRGQAWTAKASKIAPTS